MPTKPSRDVRRFIDSAIAFANAPRKDAATKAEALPQAVYVPEEWKPSWQDIEADQKQLREMLANIVDDAMDEGFEDYLSLLLDGLKTWTSFKNGHLVARYGVTSVESGCALAVALLIETGLARDLRRCPECSRYFVIYDARKRRRQYCSLTCAAEAHREKSAAKMREWRRTKKAKRKAKRKRGK